MMTVGVKFNENRGNALTAREKPTKPTLSCKQYQNNQPTDNPTQNSPTPRTPPWYKQLHRDLTKSAYEIKGQRYGGQSSAVSKPKSEVTKARAKKGVQFEPILEEDNYEKEGENLPSIRNLKSRFEVNGDIGSQASSKRVSKWDKPKEPAPPAINRHDSSSSDSEDEEAGGESEMPPAAYTRNMVARFSQMAPDAEPVERKPVRKMTPPRDELERQVTQGRTRDLSKRFSHWQ